MPSTTGIELSPESCVLVRARPARGGTEVSALHLVKRSEWPSHDVAIADALRNVRRRKRFPRRACVVVWGVPDNAPPDNAFVEASVTPLVAAGFRVQSVMSPPQALAVLDRMRVRGTGNAAAWLALNMHGVAIAIVRGGDLLYSRTFDWAYKPGIVGTKAELLQRYSLVAHLAPEVRRGISIVRASHSATVDMAVTCGDLPELRSLTMPLIEELDLEVETLDSTEGLVSISRARLDRFVESAPALRLACAAATLLPRRRLALARPARAAAAVALIGAGAWAGYRYWEGTAARPLDSRIAPASAPAAAPKSPAPSDSAVTAATTGHSAAPIRSTPPPAPEASAPAQVTPSPRTTAPPAAAAAASVPQTPPPVSSTPPPQTAPAPAPAAKSAAFPSAVGLPANLLPPPSFAMPVQSVAKEKEQEAAGTAQMALTFPRVASRETSPVEQAAPPSAAGRPGDSRATPLTLPVPVIESILISHNRRLAIVGGAIVGVGDSVGPRVVVEIDRESVVFREPSGFVLRVSLKQGPGVF